MSATQITYTDKVSVTTSTLPDYNQVMASDMNAIKTAINNNAAITDQNTTNQASVYNASSTYKIGDYCIYNGYFYVCNIDIISPEAFNSSHWNQTTIGDSIQNGGGAGHTIVDASGTDMPQEKKLQFTGTGVTSVTDDATNGKTIVTVSGEKGDAATVTVGTTTTGAAGTSASVTNSGTTSAAVLNFKIPQGAKGDQGLTPTVSVGTTSTGAAGTSATVTNTGTSTAAVFNFTIPQGAKGNPGDAASITAGSTTTLPAGSSASVTNSGTSSVAIFDFSIPQGNKGDTGNAATVSVGTTTTLDAGSNATVSNSGTTSAAILDFGIPKGSQGDAATVSVGTVTTLPAGSTATVTNSGTTGAAVFNFGIPKGQDGTGSGTITAVNTTSPISGGGTAGDVTITHAESGVTTGTYKSVTVNVTGHVIGGTNPTTLEGYGITDAVSTTGTAAKATQLATARTIAISGGATGTATAFDGTANISIPITAIDATKLSGTASVSTTGNAATATKLSPGATIGLSGVTSTAQTFDGSANVTIPITAVPGSIVTGSVNHATECTTADNYSDTGQIAISLNKKQNSLTFDTTPTSGSNNPVTSGGIYTALATKSDLSLDPQIITLSAASWNSTAHTITVSVTGVTATSNQEILPLLATSTANITNNTNLASAGIYDYGQAAGTITLYATTVPTTDLQVRVIVRGD
jgi:hypothetical protein